MEQEDRSWASEYATLVAAYNTAPTGAEAAKYYERAIRRLYATAPDDAVAYDCLTGEFLGPDEVWVQGDDITVRYLSPGRHYRASTSEPEDY